jgi:hypothetical protein
MIRGVLLDVGDTLTTPIGGRWNPRADFEDTLADFGASYGAALLQPAMAAGDQYLNQMAAQGGGDRDDYHRAVLAVLDVTATPELLAALDRPLRCDQIFEVFSDVRPALTTLKQWGLALAIVSDVGPGARKTYEELGWTGSSAPTPSRPSWAAASPTRACTARPATPSGLSPLNAFSSTTHLTVFSAPSKMVTTPAGSRGTESPPTTASIGPVPWTMF